MAEGGGEFGMDQPDLDHDIDHDDDDDDDDDDEVNTTRPFQPGTASTPYHGGEQHEMQTMQHEQSGLPETSFDETPLLTGFIHEDEKPAYIQRARDFIKRRFPRVDFVKLGPIGFSKKPGNDTTIVSFGTRGGETEIFKKDGKGLLKKFTDKFKTYLGPEAESLIAQDNEEIRENRQRLREAEKQRKEAEKINVEKEKAAQEVQDLRIRIERNQAKIDQLGSNVENESELRELQQLVKNYKEDFEKAKKRGSGSRETSKNQSQRTKKRRPT